MNHVHYFGISDTSQVALEGYIQKRGYLYLRQALPEDNKVVADVLHSFLLRQSSAAG